MGTPTEEAAAAYYEIEAKPEVAGPPWAGFWLRAEARLWDWSLLNLLAFVLVGAATLANACGMTAWGFVAAIAISSLAYPTYFAGMAWRSGQTFGKRVVGIQVVDERGCVPRGGQAVGRMLLEQLFGLLAVIAIGYLLLLGDYLSVACSQQKRAWHDMASGTYVVRDVRGRPCDALWLIPVLALWLAAVPAAKHFLGQSFYIPSGTMEPTLQEHDRVFCNKLTLRLRPPKRGDIIVFSAPPAALILGDKPKDFIKRVVGIPGDRLQVKRGKLWRNGHAVDEPYIKGPIAYLWPEGVEKGKEVVVPPGNLVVLGDNRNDSNDSHHWRNAEAWAKSGKRAAEPFLPVGNVQGVVAFRFWPPGRIGPLEQPGA